MRKSVYFILKKSKMMNFYDKKIDEHEAHLLLNFYVQSTKLLKQ